MSTSSDTFYFKSLDSQNYLSLIVAQVANKKIALLLKSKIFFHMTPPGDVPFELFSRFGRKLGANSTQKHSIHLSYCLLMFFAG